MLTFISVLTTGYILGYTVAVYLEYKALKEELKCLK